MRVGIVTDSTASLDVGDAAAEGIEVVPLQVSIDDVAYTENVEISASEIAESLVDGHEVTTSRPSPQAFEAVYSSLVDQGMEQIVSIHLSSEMSGTIESARNASANCAVPVRVVDTRTVGLATGFAAGRAARAVRDGADATHAAQIASAAAASSTVLLYVDSMEYLKRGGRVSLAGALIGSALAVKPLLTLDSGAVRALEKIRTQSKALARVEEVVVERARQCANGYQVGVQHLGNERRARQVADGISEQLELTEVPVNQLGSVIGAHVGPGTIAVTLAPY